ncbi:(2Fe-2S)-binding protein [Catenulispora rubra]|uniref:(2Fe-2S)-binding protein n=1 Tax=Catenulispora rubra TaxID=280293 RepID=UPI00189258E4|nr:(2Fe-2S)-binding protein [Catenulispora rubra]
MLTAAYQRLTSTCPALRVSISDPTSDPDSPWVRTDRLATSAESLIAFEAARIATSHGTAPPTHVAASRLLHHYLWSVALLISGPWYLEGRVPELRTSDVWIDPPTGDLTLRPGRSTPGDESTLREAVATHVEPALAAFRPFTKRGQRALWGMAADDLVSGIWHLARMLGEEARGVEVAAAVLPGGDAGLPGGDAGLPGAADFRLLADAAGREHWTRTRVSCCLYYAIEPAESCLTCPRVCDDERVRRLGV